MHGLLRGHVAIRLRARRQYLLGGLAKHLAEVVDMENQTLLAADHSNEGPDQ